MNRFKNILFVADPDADNSRALKQALTLCHNNQARLTVVSVVPELLIPGRPMLNRKIVEERKAWLSELITLIGKVNVTISIDILTGKPFIAIISRVLAHKHDLIIKPAHKEPGLVRHLFDVSDKKLLRKCPCPVWLIKSAEQHGKLEFVVALDYEPDNPENEPLNRQLLEMAASLSMSEFAEWHIVHAWQLEHEGILRSPRMGLTREDVDNMVKQEEQQRQQALSKMIEACCASHGAAAQAFLMPTLHLVQGDARTVVPEFLNDLGAELIIMGTVARTGMPGLLIGNTAEAILDQLDCSILAVKPEGFVSPITVH